MPRPTLPRITQSISYICPQCVLYRRNFAIGRRALHATYTRRTDNLSTPDASAGKEVRRSVLNVLEERGYVKEIAGDRKILNDVLSKKSIGFYAGIDPTAPSLHLGHLLPLMVLFWLYVHGHHVVSLVGGATAKVGDPSGRLTSRAQTHASVQQQNMLSMHSQLQGLWNSAEQYGKRHGYTPEATWKRALLNNATWLDELGVLDFLSMMGTGMRIGAMLGRDTVKKKLEKGDGMSFAEFTYPLLQGWDWWHMYRTRNVQVQIGGSDQYGNIVAGMDAVKHIVQSHSDAELRTHWLDEDGRIKEELAPMGLTVPLLTTASGEKFGKSAGNAIWLDKDLTSAFDLYGFLLRSSDADVERYLKLFTFVPLENISKMIGEHAKNPGKRKAQHLLAREVLELVHGRHEAQKTAEEHRRMREPTLASLTRVPVATPNERQQSVDRTVNTADSTLFRYVPRNKDMRRVKIPRSALNPDDNISFILRDAGFAKSTSEARRLVKGGSVYIGVQQNGSETLKFEQLPASAHKHVKDVQQYIKNDLLVVRVGKWKVKVLEFVNGEVGDSSKG